MGGYIEKEDNLAQDGNAWIYKGASIYGNAIVRGNAKVCEHALVTGEAFVDEDAVVCSNVTLKNSAKVCSNALIRSAFDYTVIEGFGIMDEPITFFKKADNSIGVGSDLFYDSISDFIADIKQKYGDSKYTTEYLQIAKLMECHFREE